MQASGITRAKSNFLGIRHVTIKDAISDRHFCHMTTSYCGDGIEKDKDFGKCQ